MKLISIKKRKDFVKIAKEGNKAIAKGLLIQANKSSHKDGCLHVGYTASKKVGNAVQRNRAKRRLRALSSDILACFAKTDYDYVIIGRKQILERNFEDLIKDLKYTLHSTNTHK